MKESNIVPKSSASAFVKAFDKFCVSGPQTPETREALLRDSGYVPLRRPKRGTWAFVSDNRKPAVAFTDASCSVLARSRAGQTNRVRRFVRDSFPQAVEMDATSRGRSFEQTWLVSKEPATFVGTARYLDSGNHSRYHLIYFRPDS